ncbi:MAG: hypothetical protein WC614_14020 [bacterium]
MPIAKFVLQHAAVVRIVKHFGGFLFQKTADCARWIWARCADASHNPLWVSLITVAIGSFGLLALQTHVEQEKQLQQARLEVVRDIAELYGEMIGTLNHFNKARCELMDRRLGKAEINLRSNEMQERMSKIQVQAQVLTFRIATLFEPREPWYRRSFPKVFRLSPCRPREKAALELFQGFYQFYDGFERKALALASKIPDGVPCEADDNSYLQEFHRRAPFRLTNLYNAMAPMAGTGELGVEYHRRPPEDDLQILNLTANGKAVQVECRVGLGNRADCRLK